MINYGKMAKEVAKVLKEDNKLFSEFVSNYSEVMLLDVDIRREIARNIDEADNEDYIYRFFNSDYSFNDIYDTCLDFENYIDGINSNDYSVFLRNDCDNEEGTWLPIIFIKEFWDFYFDYINKKKESENRVCSSKLGIELKQDETNIDDICKIIAEDFVKNYDSYTDIFNALDSFSNISEDDSVELFANFLKRLF